MLISANLNLQKRVLRKFQSKIPGDDWASAFMKHQGLTTNEKQAQINKEQLQEYCKVKDVPPCNIWNYDETNLKDDHGSKKYEIKHGTKYPGKIMDSSNVASVMFTQNAKGNVLSPHVVSKSTHL